MRVLLTGAAGMVGRAAAPVLRAAGHEVITTDRPGAGADLDAPIDLDDLADLADAAQAAALIGGSICTRPGGPRTRARPPNCAR